MSVPAVAARPVTPSVGLAAGRGVWVVLPTYNERENIEPMATAILAALHRCAGPTRTPAGRAQGNGHASRSGRCRRVEWCSPKEHQ